MAQDGSREEERRLAARIPVSIQVNCRIGHRFRRDALGDLSQSGLFLRTADAIEKGTPVRVAVSLPTGAEGSRICTLVGKVARTDRRGAGVQFDEEQMSEADRRALNQFLGHGAA